MTALDDHSVFHDLGSIGNVKIAAEAVRLARAKQHHGDDSIVVAQEQLHAAVEAAVDSGVSWGSIGDALGMRRGNAYQRYRRRPHPAPCVDPPPL